MSTQNKWKSLCAGTHLASECSDVSIQIARGMNKISNQYSRGDVIDKRVQWSKVDSLTLSLLWSVLNQTRPGCEFGYRANDCLMRSIASCSLLERPSMIGGICQLGFLCSLYPESSHGHKNLLKMIHSKIENESRVHIATILNRSLSGELEWKDYDIIDGLSGILAYLLFEKSGEGPVLTDLVLESMIEMVVGPASRPILESASKNLCSGFMCANGSINCGFAHGVPGVLASLSLAAISGKRHANLLRSIRRLADFLIEVATLDAGLYSWPYGIGSDLQAVRGNIPNAWCYGLPGVIRAISLAARASDCIGYAVFADEVLSGFTARIESITAKFSSAALCHGLAGILLILTRFFNETSKEEVRESGIFICQKLLERFERDYVFGYRELGETGGEMIDDPRLLSGSGGVALALLAASSTVEPKWDRMLGVS